MEMQRLLVGPFGFGESKMEKQNGTLITNEFDNKFPPQ